MTGAGQHVLIQPLIAHEQQLGALTRRLLLLQRHIQLPTNSITTITNADSSGPASRSHVTEASWVHLLLSY